MQVNREEGLNRGVLESVLVFHQQIDRETEKRGFHVFPSRQGDHRTWGVA